MRPFHGCRSARRVVGRWLVMGLVGTVLGGLPAARAQVAGGPALIDSWSYGSDAEARRAWQPMAGSPPVRAVTIEGVPGVLLECPFAGEPIERASWDNTVALDLAACRGLRFQFFCRDTSPVSQFSLYLKSGDGWYTASFYPEISGWSTITIGKAGMTSEGRPAGWDRIEAIRVSAWRGGTIDTQFGLSGLSKVGQLGADSLVALVLCESAARGGGEAGRSVEHYAGNVARCLEDAGIGYATLSDLELDANALQGAKLVILPHNPTMPEPAVDELIGFVERGGRVLAFYGMPGRMRPLVGIEQAGFERPKEPGAFAAMRFDTAAVPGVPEVVGQGSWNINEPKAVPGSSRVVAQWLDSAGKPAGHAAVVASDRAVEVSHVLLEDDWKQKPRMLTALAGLLVPELWQRAGEDRLARLGQFGRYGDFEAAIAELGPACASIPEARDALADARRLRSEAIARQGEGRHAEVARLADEAADRLRDAYCRSRRAEAGEFRAVWCHSAFGVEGMDWDTAIARLADSGFNAILPNMLWGGVAYYPSQVLPVAPEVASRGDQIAQCVAACKKYGVQIHVWKVNWNMGRAPAAFVDQMGREGRLQVDLGGKREPWLCPSHPANQELEIASMVEVARLYDVDGVHFDYIRYPDSNHCFCEGCQARFQEAIGTTLDSWPGDVVSGGRHRQAWLDWRRDNITRVVRDVSAQVRAIKPSVRISAAVFRNWPTDRDSVGQDWKLWCERGDLDFVCPMDYTASSAQFEAWVGHQVEWAGPAACYPGIGAYILSSEQVIEQIETTRRHGTRGFTLFNFDTGMSDVILPCLGAGITRPGD